MRKPLLLFFSLTLGALPALGAAQGLRVSLASDTFGERLRPVTATPFDPASHPQDSIFADERFSARSLAVDIVLNAWRVHGDDALIYRQTVTERAPIETRWRIRASLNRVMLRYEISF